MKTEDLIYQEVIDYLNSKYEARITEQDRVMKNTGNTRTCIYVGGELAAKESYGGMFRLCNQFTTDAEKEQENANN